MKLRHLNPGETLLLDGTPNIRQLPNKIKSKAIYDPLYIASKIEYLDDDVIDNVMVPFPGKLGSHLFIDNIDQVETIKSKSIQYKTSEATGSFIDWNDDIILSSGTGYATATEYFAYLLNDFHSKKVGSLGASISVALFPDSDNMQTIISLDAAQANGLMIDWENEIITPIGSGVDLGSTFENGYLFLRMYSLYETVDLRRIVIRPDITKEAGKLRVYDINFIDDREMILPNVKVSGSGSVSRTSCVMTNVKVSVSNTIEFNMRLLGKSKAGDGDRYILGGNGDLGLIITEDNRFRIIGRNKTNLGLPAGGVGCSHIFDLPFAMNTNVFVQLKMSKTQGFSISFNGVEYTGGVADLINLNTDLTKGVFVNPTISLRIGAEDADGDGSNPTPGFLGMISQVAIYPEWKVLPTAEYMASPVIDPNRSYGPEGASSDDGFGNIAIKTLVSALGGNGIKDMSFNDKSWYILFNNGFVIQGGTEQSIAIGGSWNAASVVLPIEMASINYSRYNSMDNQTASELTSWTTTLVTTKTYDFNSYGPTAHVNHWIVIGKSK